MGRYGRSEAELRAHGAERASGSRWQPCRSTRRTQAACAAMADARGISRSSCGSSPRRTSLLPVRCTGAALKAWAGARLCGGALVAKPALPQWDLFAVAVFPREGAAARVA